jgi:ubiquinone/menaquinone biosynthesis C-methylase UbiE
MVKKQNTSWGEVGEWYDDLLKAPGTYQRELILPNLIRLLELSKDDTVLDLACGQGFFSRAFAEKVSRVIGVDMAPELIQLAKNKSLKNLTYTVSPADDLKFIPDNSVNKAVIVLAIQNIENVAGVFTECARVLRKNGLLSIVMNHPAFRVPKASAWGWDDAEKIQYRRVDRYLSESREKIQMHPGDNPDLYTLTFHRPLQFYVKALQKAGFGIRRLEEWNSHKKSEPGPRAVAEDVARKEIPLFLYLEVCLL